MNPVAALHRTHYLHMIISSAVFDAHLSMRSKSILPQTPLYLRLRYQTQSEGRSMIYADYCREEVSGGSLHYPLFSLLASRQNINLLELATFI